MDHPVGRHGGHAGILLLLGQQIYQQSAAHSRSGEIPKRRDIVHARATSNRPEYLAVDRRHGTGPIWGHGSYLAPDWSADWLHREAEALLALSASQPLPGVSATQAEAMRRRAGLQGCVGTPTTLHPASSRSAYPRARDPAGTAAFRKPVRWRRSCLALAATMPSRSMASCRPRKPGNLPPLFWTAWGATTDRPGQNITYCAGLAARTPGGQ